jgi:hypothetical protein
LAVNEFLAPTLQPVTQFPQPVQAARGVPKLLSVP